MYAAIAGVSRAAVVVDVTVRPRHNFCNAALTVAVILAAHTNNDNNTPSESIRACRWRRSGIRDTTTPS